MTPTLWPGDFLVAVARRNPRGGSLVVVEHPDRAGVEMIKRVAGVPGDRVDGRPLPPGRYWVLGDHPGRSTDSRTFGPVDRSAILGVLTLRYWPLSRFGVPG